jgi:hypothetical protein
MVAELSSTVAGEARRCLSRTRVTVEGAMPS